MSFTRVNGAGWAAGAELTAAQLTALDRDHANTLDKRGDTVPSGSTITWANGSFLTIAAGAVMTVDGTLRNASGKHTLNTRLTVAGAAADLTVSASANILVTGAGSLVRTSGGVAGGARVQLGDNDYPTFSPARSVTRLLPLCRLPVIYAAPANWVASKNGPKTLATASPLVMALPYRMVRAGATITQIDLYFTVDPGHLSLPAAFPGVALLQRNVATGAGVGPRVSVASGAYTATLDSYNSGNVKKLTLGSLAVVTNGAYEYAIQLTEESGGGATGGTTFHAVGLTYSLSDMGTWG